MAKAGVAGTASAVTTIAPVISFFLIMLLLAERIAAPSGHYHLESAISRVLPRFPRHRLLPQPRGFEGGGVLRGLGARRRCRRRTTARDVPRRQAGYWAGTCRRTSTSCARSSHAGSAASCGRINGRSGRTPKSSSSLLVVQSRASTKGWLMRHLP